VITYKKGESLLELRDLLFGKGVGLLLKTLSAYRVPGRWMQPDCPSSAGLPPSRFASFILTDHVDGLVSDLSKRKDSVAVLLRVFAKRQEQWGWAAVLLSRGVVVFK
jgi:hypothetical protein